MRFNLALPLIIMIGFPIVWITFVVARGLADLERMRANVLLATDVPRVYLPDDWQASDMQ